MFPKLSTISMNKTSYLLSWGIVLGYLCLAVFFPELYILATYENLPGEWLQVGFYFIAAIISFSVLRSGTPYRWFFWMLGIAAVYVGMEEISWGQQIFGWGSPEFFRSQNLQGETNLHNMIAGPYSTTLKDVAAFSIALILWGYGIIYPMLISRWPQYFGWVERLGVPVPADNVWVFFFFAGLLEVGIFNFNEAEIAELLIGSGLMMVALQHRQYLLSQNVEALAPVQTEDNLPVSGPVPVPTNVEDVIESTNTREVIEDTSSAPLEQRQPFFSLNLTPVPQVAVCVAVGLLFSAIMTGIILTDEVNGTIAKERYYAGLESFGNRYAGYGANRTSIKLYLKRLKREPTRITTRRNLASLYYIGGWPEHGERTLREAARIEEKRLLNEPHYAQLLHVSLAQTYELLYDEDKRQYHLNQAVFLAEEAVAAHPSDVQSHFVLSHAYLAMGRLEDALAAVNVAFEEYPDYYDYRHLRHEIMRAIEERGHSPSIAKVH